ncbi:MAG: hypothetical protein L6R42_008999 [Xanthoria sp. 1 TBL-2021]|nr:MAG: hypothetical protein L6R42_008999 [Xanthoria sp. 1 TBL-2021]
MHLEPRQQETVVQVIYKTAEKTFDGPIGGYRTLDGSEDSGNNAFVAAPSPQTQEAQAQPAPTPVEEPTQAPQAQPTPTPVKEPNQAPQAPAQVQSTPIAESPTTPTPKLQTPAAAPQQEDPTTQTPIVAPVATSVKSNPKPATPGSSSNEAKSTPTAKNPNQDSNSLVSQVSSQITGATPTQDSSASSSSNIAQNAAGSSASTPGAGASNKSDGMSGGAKAGLAIGILLAIGLVLGLIFFCYRRKKKQQQSEAYKIADDEKFVPRDASGAAALGRAASTRTTSTAPRLSLRPVTQFLPDLAGRRKSGNTLATAGGRSLAPTDNMNEKRPQQNQSTNPTNPFGDHAEPSEKAMTPRRERSMIPNHANNPTNPFGNHAETVEQPANITSSVPTDAPVPAPLRIRTPTPEGHAPAVGSVGAAGAALAAAGVAGRKNDAPKPLNLSPKRSASPAPMPSPSGTEFSMNSVTPAAMANGPPPSNVHRVQLDFKPSMEDELALRAGQLVRLLHEYDDGWALCIRLDRSQQGVAPRTCLSARPVKPRPNPNARGPPPRGPPPPGMFNSGQQRPMSPSSGRGSPSPYDRGPRGMAPGPHGGQRSMSPGPYGGGPQRPNIPPPGGRRRSNSASEVRERRMSPPGPSPMNPNAQGILSGAQKVPLQQQAVVRPDQVPLSSSPPASIPARKPVPGQAM